ncbi:MAG TPA: sterol-binding protein [Gammaproteobacteria bacterium]|nr:sterol-binding protein [Gammaproteobacteria bacterium]
MLILETAINRYLALDPEMLEKLAVFEGKVIKMEVTGLGRALYLLPDKRGMRVVTEYEGDSDTTLRGSVLSLFKMGLTSDTAALLLRGEVEITGDTRLGHQFKSVFKQMDIDWSEPLADLVGDGIAFQLHRAGQRFGQWARHSARSFSDSTSEYLQEESRDVVTETELNIFNDAVDRLRDDVDRLQKKIQSLQVKQD